MRADYDPQGLLDLMKLFKEKSMNIKLLEFTQTHPIPDSRIEYLNEYIAQKKQAEKSKKPKNEIKNLDQAKKEEQEKMSFENNKEVKLKKELNNDIIKFNYPEEWDLEEEKSVDSQTIFKFHFNNQDTEGEFILQDLSFKDFMDTARKHYNYALLEAEAEGKMPNKSTRKINDLSIYRLQWSESDQFFYKYYLESEKSKKMLKISFVSDKDSLERREGVFERLINTVQFN